MKRILCIRLPNWPIQRLVAARPELENHTIVLHQSQRGVQRVTACCHQAAVRGVSVGMPLAEVKAGWGLGVGGWGMGVLAHEPDADQEALGVLAEHCGRFSPIVGLENSPASDGLFLDITGVARLFGGEAALANEIAHDFTRQGLAVRIAIADTVGAAYAISTQPPTPNATCGRNQSSMGPRPVRGENTGRGPILQTCAHGARMSMHKDSNPQSPTPNPQPLFILIPPGETSAALRPLPVDCLRLSPSIVDLLRQLGICRIGQLEALPRCELSSRFGEELLRRMDQAAGRLAEPVVAHRSRPRFDARFSLEHATSRRATIEALLEQLIEQVARKLSERGCGAVRLECLVEGLGDGGWGLGIGGSGFGVQGSGFWGGGLPDQEEFEGKPVLVSVGLFEPTASAKHLFGLARLQLERLRLPGPVAALQVVASVTAPLNRRQQELFYDGSAQRNSGKPTALVDQLSSRLGRRAVLRVRSGRDAQPELAWRYDPLLDGSRRRRRSVFETTGLPPRPLRLLCRPISLRSKSTAPDGPPLLFQLRNREHRVAQSWGPERIETGWWRGQVIGRDYYRIETVDGRRFWLFRRLRDGRWFLHGVFE